VVRIRQNSPIQKTITSTVATAALVKLLTPESTVKVGALVCTDR
jgi:hypothetical protein